MYTFLCYNSFFTVPPKILRPPSIANIITTNQATLTDVPLPDFPFSELPSLTHQPWIAHAGQVILIHVGLSVRIDCVTERGSPEPTLSWWTNNTTVQNTSKIEVYNNGSMLIKNAEEAVEGVYTCFAVTSGLPSDQLNATLSIIGELNL